MAPTKEYSGEENGENQVQQADSATEEVVAKPRGRRRKVVKVAQEEAAKEEERKEATETVVNSCDVAQKESESAAASEKTEQTMQSDTEEKEYSQEETQDTSNEEKETPENPTASHASYTPRSKERYENTRQRWGRERYQRNSRYSRRDNSERQSQARAEIEAMQRIENVEEYESKPRLLINDLTKMSMPDLRNLATQYGINEDDLAPMKKQEVIFVILKAHTEHGGIIFASGALEILPDGYGFSRPPGTGWP